jgi:DNA-binding IclR family transcriptional regulator
VPRRATNESVLQRAARILSAFTQDEPALRVSEIARRSDLHLATASRLVAELVDQGFLSRDSDRRVRIGVRLWELASRASPTVSLREAAMPFMEDLHSIVGHHTQLGILQGDEVLFLERLSAPGAVVNITQVAGRLPLYCSATGLVLLAHSPREVQARAFERPMPPYTDRTITTATQLRTALARIRQEGFAVCAGHIHKDATGVAVPIRDRQNTVIAGLAVIVPNDTRAKSQVPALWTAARGISRQISGADPDRGRPSRRPLNS